MLLYFAMHSCAFCIDAIQSKARFIDAHDLCIDVLDAIQSKTGCTVARVTSRLCVTVIL